MTTDRTSNLRMLAAVALLLVSCDSTSLVDAKVTDASSTAPVSEALVRVSCPEGQGVNSVEGTTDADGRLRLFAMGCMVHGCTVSISAPGFDGHTTSVGAACTNHKWFCGCTHAQVVAKLLKVGL
jgi:hypothetical protein